MHTLKVGLNAEVFVEFRRDAQQPHLHQLVKPKKQTNANWADS